MKSAAQFPVNDLILAMTSYLPVRHSHCTKTRFTVLVSWSGELAVRLCSIAWPTLGADFSAVGHYCVTITWFTSSYDSRRFTSCCCWTQVSWQIVQRDVTADSGSHVVLYCEVLPAVRFSRTIGLFFYCIVGYFLLLRFFRLVLSKCMRFFQLFLRNIFISTSIVFVNFAEGVGFVLTWSNARDCWHFSFISVLLM